MEDACRTMLHVDAITNDVNDDDAVDDDDENEGGGERNNVSFVVAGGMSELVGLLGGRFADNAGVMEAVCQLLCNFSGPRMATFVELEGMVPLVSLLRGTLKSHAGVMKQACHFVIRACLYGVVREAAICSFFSAGGIPPLADLLRGELNRNVDVMQNACGAVNCSISDAVCSQEAFATAGGIASLLALLRGELAGNGGVVQEVCSVLASSYPGATPDVRKADFCDNGGILTVVGLLHGMLMNDSNVIVQATQALSAFMRDDEHNVIEFSSAGGIPHLIALLRGALKDDKIACEQVCTLIGDILINDTTKSEFLGAGGLPPLVEVLRGPLNDVEDVQRWACRAIRKTGATDAFVALGGLTLLIALLKKQLNDNTVESVARLLLNVTVDEPCRLVFAAAGGVFPMFSSLERIDVLVPPVLTNVEGITVHAGTRGSGIRLLYCGRMLEWGGSCGPDDGPQCPSCAQSQGSFDYRVYGASCNGCHNDIIGARFRCKRCPKFDACGDCAVKAAGSGVVNGALLHDASHPLHLSLFPQSWYTEDIAALRSRFSPYSSEADVSSVVLGGTRKYSLPVLAAAVLAPLSPLIRLHPDGSYMPNRIHTLAQAGDVAGLRWLLDHGLPPWVMLSAVAPLQNRHSDFKWIQPAFPLSAALWEPRLSDLARGKVVALLLSLAAGESPWPSPPCPAPSALPLVLSHALMVAANTGRLSVVATLLTRFPAADPAWEQQVALKMAAREGWADVVALLLKDPRVDPTVDSQDPLMKAVVRGQIEVVRVLLADARVDLLAKSSEAVFLAELAGHTELLALLRADPRVQAAQ